MYTATGIKAVIVGLGILALVIIVLVATFHVIIFLLPLILVLILLSYFFKMLNKIKKGKKKDYVDVKFKVK
jgi:4-amino-4-deoxy-L-arabinose transferase-like glycosyltransferase